MNSEHQEQQVLIVIERACAKLGIAVRAEVGEYTSDYNRSLTLVSFYYDNSYLKNRTRRIAFWLGNFAFIYFVFVSIIKEDSALFLPFFNVVFSLLTEVVAKYQHVATNTERNLAIQLALNEAGFAVYMTEERFHVFL